MSRRIEVELTSDRGDGSWTWRAAGAREPRGVLDGTLLPTGAGTGDVLRADVDTGIDGTTVLAVLAPKGKRAEPERLELLPSRQKEELVTSTLVGRGRGDRGDRGPRRDRDDRRDDRPRPRPGDGEGRTRRPPGKRPAGAKDDERRSAAPRPDSRERTRSARPPRKERPAPPVKPRAKRLRAGRAHRKAVLDALPPEQQVVAEQVLRGGVPAVRQAVDKQNEQARAEGHPEVKADPLLALAEQLLPRLRAAEWHDRAEAALTDVDELDLRDLRSVVVAADTAAKDDATRDLAGQLRAALSRRVDQEQSAWLTELASTLADDRVVRALRLSSRPPKAGSPIPSDLTARLASAASAALTADTVTDRWATVLDALSFAPVRLTVTPQSIPDKPSDDLVAAIKRVSDRLPQIAALFGVEPEPTPKRPGSSRARRSRPRGASPTAAPTDASNRPVPPPPRLDQTFGGAASATPAGDPIEPAEISESSAAPVPAPDPEAVEPEQSSVEPSVAAVLVSEATVEPASEPDNSGVGGDEPDRSAEPESEQS